MEAGSQGHGRNTTEPCGSSDRAMIGGMAWSDSEGFCSYFITGLAHVLYPNWGLGKE